MKNDMDNMDNDDEQVGRLLGRRELLALFGAAGLGFLVGCSTSDTTVSSSTCFVHPALTEGPYFVDEKLNRSDVRSDPSDGSLREGVLLQLAFNVYNASNACAPLPGATVDIWHCDALGVYSDVIDQGFNTVGKKFLRGYQQTDANGQARFTTIYPGWYQGRTVHLHFKIRTTLTASRVYEFTSQLFFDEGVTDLVHARQPYASKGQRTLKNAGDGIYNGGGSQLLIVPQASGQDYAATFDIGLRIG